MFCVFVVMNLVLLLVNHCSVQDTEKQKGKLRKLPQLLVSSFCWKKRNKCFYHTFGFKGHRGLVGLFVNNKFMLCQGSKVHIPALPPIFSSSKPNSNAIRCESFWMKTRCEKRTWKPGSCEASKRKMKNRQVDQEWLREWFCSFRRRLI